jgi:murein DD-endopeptidase MepM/ murein hydrolase activator NlpD
MRRDAQGEPVDEVRAIADGKIVHASRAAGTSNYGKYVVIEHRWDGSNYYSLYGHLSDIRVEPEAVVQRGQTIGRMGHTGEGINRERSHVHLELNLMLSHHFNGWHQTFFPNEPNYHDIYNGLNLAGLDISRLYLASRKDPTMTVAKFVRAEPAFYTVAIPGSANFELPASYLTRGDLAGRGKSAHLTDTGKRAMRLLIFPD